MLFIRLSSFGDIIQCLFAADALKQHDPACEIHWVVRSEFAALLQSSASVSQVWSFDRKSGLLGWLELGLTLRRMKFDLVYDAHNNLRSAILMILLFFQFGFQKRIRRSKQRIRRFLFFSFRMQTLPRPYQGSISYLEPLYELGIKTEAVPQPAALPLHRYAVLAPSAAWQMKRWPEEHWRTLIAQLGHEIPIELVGGPEDKFMSGLTENSPNIRNRAGQLSYAETQNLVRGASLVISADTGVLHLADYWARPTIGLIGPTAFGYTTRKSSQILEVELPCKPCSKDGRGGCSNAIYQLCMKQITPDLVLTKAREILRRATT